MEECCQIDCSGAGEKENGKKVCKENCCASNQVESDFTTQEERSKKEAVGHRVSRRQRNPQSCRDRSGNRLAVERRSRGAYAGRLQSCGEGRPGARGLLRSRNERRQTRITPRWSSA